MRISREIMFMEVAQVVAKRSTCFRLNVGAVATANNRIVSIGYNGVPSGQPHCSGNDCPGRERCTLTVHAEVNALNHADNVEDLYTTHSPCEECVQAIIKKGVRRLYFATPYRITEHLALLRPLVHTIQVMPSGYLMNWHTKAVREA